MKILIIAPSMNIHGGLRVLVEWANHLHKRGHDVTLQVEDANISPAWIDISEGVTRRPGSHWVAAEYDVAIAGTPNIALRLDQQHGAKKFFLLQMAEDLFAPGNRRYVQDCMNAYKVRMPIIGISKWVEEYVRAHGRGDGRMYYIGNGVSDHFKPGKKDPELTVLAEGWEGYNPAKDTDKLTARCAAHLKMKYGAHIIAYSQFPMSHNANVPDEYYRAPGTEQIKQLYQRAHLMIKATRLDARSCAPVEAMACGTVTARAIQHGDDDLMHGYNCLRSDYKLDELIYNAEALIEETDRRRELEENGLKYREKYLSWDYWMEKVENIILSDDQPVIEVPEEKTIQPRRRMI